MVIIFLSNVKENDQSNFSMKSTKYENIEFGKCERFGKQGNIPTPRLKNYPTAGVLYRPPEEMQHV